MSDQTSSQEERDAILRMEPVERYGDGTPKTMADPVTGHRLPRKAWQSKKRELADLVNEGEAQVAEARKRGKKKSKPRDRAERPTPPPAGTTEANEDQAQTAALSMMFTTLGSVLLNKWQGLQPEFTEEMGATLAKAWQPVLSVYIKSPLAIALTVTTGILAPYAGQLVFRELTRPSPPKPAPTNPGAGGRDVTPQADLWQGPRPVTEVQP